MVEAPVTLSGSDKVHGIQHFDSLVHNLELVRTTARAMNDFTLAIGGDCSIDIAPIEVARERYGDGLTVLWIDAHPDVYSPSTLGSGAFHAMVVRALLGDVAAQLGPRVALRPEQIKLIGERADVAVEQEYLRQRGIERVTQGDLHEFARGLSGPVYVHVDLDVLDPPRFAATCYPEPDGVTPEDLVLLIESLSHVVGGALTEHAPREAASRDTDLEVIGMIGAALLRHA